MKFSKAIFIFLLATSIFACKSEPASKSSNVETKVEESVTTKIDGPLSDMEIKEYTLKGKSIAQLTFKTLAKNLKKAMKKGGPQLAIPFCNSQAMGLVDSLMKAENVIIKRTSNKIRNPKNKPSAIEGAQIAAYQMLLEEGKPIKPQIVQGKDNKVVFYAPIKTKGLCLKCHGTVGKTMKKADFELVKKLYPEDTATGYGEDELRGIWSIQFDRK